MLLHRCCRRLHQINTISWRIVSVFVHTSSNGLIRFVTLPLFRGFALGLGKLLLQLREHMSVIITDSNYASKGSVSSQSISVSIFQLAMVNVQRYVI